MADTDTLTATPPRAARSAEADPLPAVPAAPPAVSDAPLRARTARSVGPSLSELEFVGCEPVPVTREQLHRYEGRFELWDAKVSTTWVLRDPTSVAHESPCEILAGLLERIAEVRGSRIARFGSMDLEMRDARGKTRRIMQADQTVYLRPWRGRIPGPDSMVLGEHSYPDVVMEVDNTTDVRRGKLALYEAWGFPEVWVEVPDVGTRRRPKSLLPGLTIYRLESGKYQESRESGAFPGWRAVDIHMALNEPECSERTAAILERLGRRLGSREGTGPDHDPLLRSLRGESRGQGRTEARMEMVRQMLLSRGIEVSRRFPFDVPGFAGSTEAEIVSAAIACESEEDFRARITQI